MSNQYICNSSKYIFSHETIALPVFLDDLPKGIIAEEVSFTLKSKFHISLVPIGKILEKQNIDPSFFKEAVLADFCEYIKKALIEFIDFSNEYRFAWENNLRSLVVMCKVSNLDGFFELINKKYGLNIETPPTHITIYTSEPEVGIFLTNSKDIKQMTKIVDVSNLDIYPIGARDM